MEISYIIMVIKILARSAIEANYRLLGFCNQVWVFGGTIIT